MRIALVSEMGYDGKPEEHNRFRTCWEILADELPLTFISYNRLIAIPRTLKDFDITIFIIPKKNPNMCKTILRFMKVYPDVKTIVLQEGPWWIYQEWTVPEQALYLELVGKVDSFFAMSDDAEVHYKAIAKNVKRVRFAVDTERIPKEGFDNRNCILVSGNAVPWYNGTSGVLVGLDTKEIIKIPTMGRNNGIESIDWEHAYPNKHFIQLPYLSFQNWMMLLAGVKAVVHLFPQCAGERVPMECAAVGTPCIGNLENSVASRLFPGISVMPYDIKVASRHLNLLLDDEAFYSFNVGYAQDRLKEYSPKTIAKDWMKKLGEVMK